jgi:ATP-dependent Lhr-like helicase
VTADSFHGLRAVLTPQSRRRGFRGRSRMRGSSGFDAAGRWALLEAPRPHAAPPPNAVEHAAKTLLRRYGVMCRKLLAREALAPSWRELLPFYRSAEARGEIRGGRFVEPLGGEQFALIEAVEELRRLRRSKDADDWVVIAAMDPVNVVSLIDDSPRTPAAAARRLAFRNGVAVAARGGTGLEWLADLSPAEQRAAAARLMPDAQASTAPRASGWSRR